jgi:hypothetical protein
LGNADGAPGLIDDIAKLRRAWSRRLWSLRAQQLAPAAKQNRRYRCGVHWSKLEFVSHCIRREIIGSTKKPHETAWGFSPALFLAKNARFCGLGGYPGLRRTADHSGGTAAESHGLPRCPSLQIEIRV